MTAPRRRLRHAGLSVMLALAAAGSGVAGTSAALTTQGAEFDRITADIRAAVERHDSRAAHVFGAQLDLLIARAIAR